MGTIPTIQLFRNSIIKTGRQAAIDALEAQKAKVADGGLILARYSEDGSENGVKTLLGIVRNGGGTNVQITIIDVEGAAENVQSAITSAINKLNKTDTEEVGQYVSSVSEDKGIITVTRKPLPSFGEKTESGKAITAITQTNGLVDVKFGGVAAANVSVADEGNKFTATNVEGALLEIKNFLDNAIGAGGTVEEQISAKINALDSSATSTNNYFDVTVAQEDGKITSITVTNKDIASAELLGTITDTKDKATAFGRIAQEVADREAAIGALNFGPVGDTGKVITAIKQTNGVVNATADTLSASFVAFTASNTAFKSSNVKDALDTLYAQSGEGSKVTLESAEGTESGVLKVYTIKQGDREVGTINIPKDLVVTSGSVVKGTWDGNTFTENASGKGTALKLVIANQTAPVYINTLDLVKDHTAGSGIAISETNEISVKRDTASENFLTVGADGVKLDGVQNAISAASGHVNTIIDARLGAGVTSESTATDQFAALSGQITSINATIDSLDATVTGGSTHVDVTVGQANGKITSVTVANKDIASATDLTNEITNRTNAIKGISGDTTIDNGKVITAISQRNGIVSVTAATLGAENVSASTITDDGTKVAVTGDNVKAQIESLAKSIKSASTAAAAAHTKVEAKTDGHVTVTVAKSNDGSHDVVTVGENNIASATALAAETSSRQSQDDKIEDSIGLDAEGNHKTTTGNYTSGAITVVGEIAALDTKLKEVSDTLGTGVTTAEGKTVTEQLQALSGTSESNSGDTSVNGAKKYTEGKIAEINATIVSTSGTSTTEAIKLIQTNGKIDSITLGAFDCGTY